MALFLVSTDSGCDLSAETLRQHDVRPIFMNYTVDGVSHPDTMEPAALDSFYQAMQQGAVPKTSSISIGEFTEYFSRLAQEGLPIVHIALGAGISGTYQNAVHAAGLVAEEHPGAAIHVVNSSLASLGYGILVLKAAAMRDDGVTAEDCVAELEHIKHGISPYYTTNDLTYLYRGGRVSRGGMIIAHALGIQPILDLDYEGHLRVCSKARGQKQTWAKLAAFVRERAIDPEKQVLYISHASAPEKAREFGAFLQKEVGFPEVYYSCIGSIIGAHTGPGLVACFFEGHDRPAD